MVAQEAVVARVPPQAAQRVVAALVATAWLLVAGGSAGAATLDVNIGPAPHYAGWKGPITLTDHARRATTRRTPPSAWPGTTTPRRSSRPAAPGPARPRSARRPCSASSTQRRHGGDAHAQGAQRRHGRDRQVGDRDGGRAPHPAGGQRRAVTVLSVPARRLPRSGQPGVRDQQERERVVPGQEHAGTIVRHSPHRFLMAGRHTSCTGAATTTAAGWCARTTTTGSGC